MASLRFILIVYLMYLENIASTNLDGNELDFVINGINDMKNYISKMKDLELKVSKMDALELKIAKMEDRDSKVSNMDNLEPRVDEMKVLVSKVAKLEDLVRVGTLRTCDEYSQYGITTDGLYVVDPDGVLNGEEPFEVFCNFTDGSTQILHDAELLTDIDHCNDPGCFHKTINYRDSTNGNLVPLSQLEALISLSNSCTQEFVYQCNLAPLKDHRQNYAYWEDRNGEENYYFHGSHKDVHSCACHYSDEGCEQAVDKGNTCSCDANVPVPLQDTGIISNMNALPVRIIYFGGLRYASQTAKFRLGRLKCTGKAEFEEGNSCSALKKVGVMRSGLYNIKKDGDTRTSLVHCNMTGDGYENVPETDEISSSSPLGTIAAWVHKVDTDSHEESLPDGWLPCDGTTITKGPWAGGKTPDLNTMGRFLRGGTEEEILTLEDHQVQDHEHIDNGHSHTSSPHTHTNTPHTHSNSPHSHRYKDTSYGWSGGNYLGKGIYTNKAVDKTTDTASINIQKSSVTISSSTVNIQSSSSGIGGISSTANKGGETRPINARVIWIMRVY